MFLLDWHDAIRVSWVRVTSSEYEVQLSAIMEAMSEGWDASLTSNFSWSEPDDLLHDHCGFAKYSENSDLKGRKAKAATGGSFRIALATIGHWSQETLPVSVPLS